MKWLLVISFLFCASPGFSQDLDPAALSRRLTHSYATEEQKVTAIFKWITSNIGYLIKPNRRKVIGKNSLKNYQSEIEADDGSPLKPLNERVSEIVLKKRIAVCDGYARLFTTLCDFAGIRSQVIVGYGRAGSNKPTDRFAVN